MVQQLLDKETQVVTAAVEVQPPRQAVEVALVELAVLLAEEVLQLADAPGQAPESVRLMIKSGATRELGRPGEADELVRAALRASVADQRITQTI